MMRSMVGGFCVAMVVFAAVMAVWPEGRTNLIGVAYAESTGNAKASGKKSIDMTQVDRDNQKIRNKLKQKIDVEFVDEPLNQVLEYLEERIEVQFYLDPKSIVEQGLSADVPITFSLKNVPVELILKLIFEQIELSYYVDSGVVIVTTEEAMDQNLSVQMYDVKSLVGESSCSYAEMSIGLGGGRSGFGVGRGGKFISDSPGVEQNGIVFGCIIQQAVGPQSWMSSGGPGTLSVYRGILIVRQTEWVHEEIGKVLDQLRDKLKNSPPKTRPSPATNMPGMRGRRGMRPGVGGIIGGRKSKSAGAKPGNAKPDDKKRDKKKPREEAGMPGGGAGGMGMGGGMGGGGGGMGGGMGGMGLGGGMF